tara:strand:+ start:249 stop:509 length:261 start_codon:yes stop_codon:yes gene_type:complete
VEVEHIAVLLEILEDLVVVLEQPHQPIQFLVELETERFPEIIQHQIKDILVDLLLEVVVIIEVAVVEVLVQQELMLHRVVMPDLVV